MPGPLSSTQMRTQATGGGGGEGRDEWIDGLVDERGEEGRDEWFVGLLDGPGGGGDEWMGGSMD